MSEAFARWRHAVRAIILAPDDSVLLCRFAVPHPAVPIDSAFLWAAPGGGIEPGESALQALDRELREETGFELEGEPPHVWHQQIAGLGSADGYDGVVNDYFLVRTARFDPRPALSDAEIAAENISELRWWQLDDIVGYRGPDLFSPRELGRLLPPVIAGEIPREPMALVL